MADFIKIKFFLLIIISLFLVSIVIVVFFPSDQDLEKRTVDNNIVVSKTFINILNLSKNVMGETIVTFGLSPDIQKICKLHDCFMITRVLDGSKVLSLGPVVHLMGAASNVFTLGQRSFDHTRSVKLVIFIDGVETVDSPLFKLLL